MMMDEGYKMVTPFFIEDGGKAGTYSWEYVLSELPGRTVPYEVAEERYEGFTDQRHSGVVSQ